MSRAGAYRAVARFSAGGWSEARRAIPQEAPVAIVPNGRAFAAVMATPADLEDLAIGFAVTERLVGAAAEIGGVEVVPVDEGYEARIVVPDARADALAARRRAFAARTSCSLCGFEDLDLLLAAKPAPRPAGLSLALAPDALLAAMSALPNAQSLTAATHGLHAAGWIDPSGALALAREDVGRHNALDKTIGALLRQGLDPAAGAICLTSRCSIEMVLKAATVGVGLIAAASSPTELAVRAAEAAGIALIGGVRDGAFDVYACADLILGRAA